MQPRRDTGDSPKPPPAPARGPGKGSAPPEIYPRQVKKSHFSALPARGGLWRRTGVGPVPPVPMEKGFLSQTLGKQLPPEPLSCPPRVYSPRVNKEKQTFLVLVHTRPRAAGAGRLCLADQRLPDGARSRAQPQAWLGGSWEAEEGTKIAVKRFSLFPFSLPRHRDASPRTNPAGQELKFALSASPPNPSKLWGWQS